MTTHYTSLPKVGQKILFWGSGREDGLSTVLEVRPYKGSSPQYSTHVIRVTAENTRRGWAEFSWGPTCVWSDGSDGDY